MTTWVRTLHVFWCGIEFGVRKSSMNALANGTLWDTWYLKLRRPCDHRPKFHYWTKMVAGCEKHCLNLGILAVCWGSDLVEV
jgi:hypothetical protein